MHKSAFTLVEVMMAVLLLATVAATLMKVVNNSLRQLAQAQIEVSKEHAIYEVIAADAISDDDTVSGGNIEDLDGVVWYRSDSEAFLDDDLSFKLVQINLQSDKFKITQPNKKDVNLDTIDAEVVIERID